MSIEVGQVREDVKSGRFLLVTFIYNGDYVEARTVQRPSARDLLDDLSWKWSVKGPDVLYWQPDVSRRTSVRMKLKQMESYPVVATPDKTLKYTSPRV